jgi:hypothetical protein
VAFTGFEELMSDSFVFLCNACSKNQCDCMVTESIPERNIWAGDTYHQRCVPSGVKFCAPNQVIALGTTQQVSSHGIMF